MNHISKIRSEMLRSDISLKEIEEYIDHKIIFGIAKDLKLELDVDEDPLPLIPVTISVPTLGISQILDDNEDPSSPVRELLKKMPDYVLDFLSKKVRDIRTPGEYIIEDYRLDQMIYQEECEKECRTYGTQYIDENYEDDWHESDPFS